MNIDYKVLVNSPRLLMEAELRPLQGQRFQPTGFADLGPGKYTLADNTEMLLVESAQSVANRMELACCQDDKRTLLPQLAGLPYVCSKHKGEVLTTSYLEAHRLSSPYLLNEEWAKKLAGELNLRDDFPLNDQQIFRTFFKFDPCSLLHGVWLALEKYSKTFSGGRVRVTRALSGLIEASSVKIAESGGTKFDRNAARTEENANAKTGYGTLPFHRTEFTGKIVAYFNLDLGLLRGYRLGDDATKLLIALALLKVRRFLSHGLRLRTACDLETVGDLVVTRPQNFVVPGAEVLLTECQQLIKVCGDDTKLFAEPRIREVEWTPPTGNARKIELPVGTAAPAIPDDLRERVKLKAATRKKGPTLEFPQGIDAALAERVKSLFEDNKPVADAITKLLTEQTGETNPGDGGANAGDDGQ